MKNFEILSIGNYIKKHPMYTYSRVKKMCEDGILRAEKTSGGHWRILDGDITMEEKKEYEALRLENQRLKETLRALCELGEATLGSCKD